MLTKGRICYIEPTTDVGENKGSGYVAPLEDYDIAVDLKIIKGNRYACGVGNQSGESNIMEFSSEKGTINFIGGTNGYVGTNFTEVSMKEVVIAMNVLILRKSRLTTILGLIHR